MNRILQNSNFEALWQQIQTTYETPVVGLFPNCDEMMQRASSDLFYLCYPDQALSQEIKPVAHQIMA